MVLRIVHLTLWVSLIAFGRNVRSMKLAAAAIDPVSPYESPIDPVSPYESPIDPVPQPAAAPYSAADSYGRVTRAANKAKRDLWEYGVIPFTIDNKTFSVIDHPTMTLFSEAMQHWEKHTCLKFVERDPRVHSNYIEFTVESCGCCSYVGKLRWAGKQTISIGPYCRSPGTVLHELGHAIGFSHEHSRPDRDQYVSIIEQNIANNQESNFNLKSESEVDSLGFPYDYESIMHYGKQTFSKSSNLVVIQPLHDPGQPEPEIGQRTNLSDGDIAQTNALYNCPKCGETFQDHSGAFSSPGYYALSQSNIIASIYHPEHCEWRITGRHDARIALNITRLAIPQSLNCSSDYLEIRDGYWHRSPMIGRRICGFDRVNELFVTHSNRMLITYYRTTPQKRGRYFNGFTATYETACGGEATGGQIKSPNYPERYWPNQNCVWLITVPEGHQVALQFITFDVENSTNCVRDYVEVRDGHSAASELIAVYCGGPLPRAVQSTLNKMHVRFVSNGAIARQGFHANYTEVVNECLTPDHGCSHMCINTIAGYDCACPVGYKLLSDNKTCDHICGGTIDALNGTITSPSYPDDYPASTTCLWTIKAPPSYTIALLFTSLNIEGNFHSSVGCYDFVSVYSKLNESAHPKLLGTFCGNKVPQPQWITSESNIMQIKFVSDYTIQRSGFEAIFNADINECVTNNGGCQHTCTNAIGSYLCACYVGHKLDANGRDCNEDDGDVDDYFEPEGGRLGGNRNNGNCEHKITALQGRINSPNFPEKYPPNLNCVWRFSTIPGHRIKLEFIRFSLELSRDQRCICDSVTIYDGNNNRSSLGKFCDNVLPPNMLSSSTELRMDFKSDASVQREGFAVLHSTVCGGRLQATDQVQYLYSHAGYDPKAGTKYDALSKCDWSIEAAMGKRINLTFTAFELESDESCSFDCVVVLDGQQRDMLGSFCGLWRPKPIVSETNLMDLAFRTDASHQFRGFAASYVAIDAAATAGELDVDLNTLVVD